MTIVFSFEYQVHRFAIASSSTDPSNVPNHRCDVMPPSSMSLVLLLTMIISYILRLQNAPFVTLASFFAFIVNVASTNSGCGTLVQKLQECSSCVSSKENAVRMHMCVLLYVTSTFMIYIGIPQACFAVFPPLCQEF